MKDKSDDVTLEMDFSDEIDDDSATELSIEDEDALLALVGLAQGGTKSF